ncbi:hypothetical protein P8452_17255 [Trifolium repens]|nr:hypothetical protein P8452_17255 [Trifolium repens]
MSSEILEEPKEGGKQKNVENHGGESSHLIPQLDHDTSINCLIRLSRSDYGSIAALNQSFRSVVKDGELYEVRRKMGIIGHWIYFSCHMASEKWQILVGGYDQHRNILSSSELYNSDTGTWEILPDMTTARRMCSAVFMDEKFYVLGGVGVDETTPLTCGEEFDLKTRKWRKIPNMCPPRNGRDGANETPINGEAPPLITVVNNVLYAADYAQQVVKRYVKDKNSWVTIGSLPDRVISCGDKLVVIGSPSHHGQMGTKINAWVVDEGAPQWNLLAVTQSGNFAFNCAVMGC